MDKLDVARFSARASGDVPGRPGERTSADESSAKRERKARFLVSQARAAFSLARAFRAHGFKGHEKYECDSGIPGLSIIAKMERRVRAIFLFLCASATWRVTLLRPG